MRVLAALALILAAGAVARAADWPVFGFDASRSSNAAGTHIAAGDVSGLRLRWRTTLGAVADEAPIFISAVRVRGRSTPMLYITARNGTTYGIDAADGHTVWRFVTHGPGITTAVPAADPDRSWIYAGGVDGFVHKLAAASGVESRAGGFPVRITRIPESEKNAAALNIANGYLYAATSGYLGDAPPYVGHVVAIRLNDGATHVFNTLCSNLRSLPSAQSCAQSGSGIWSRAGVVVDPDPRMHGRIYLAAGNGRFDADRGGTNYGDSVIALSADASRIEGSYTPSNFAELDSGDVDLGSSAPALLPRDERSRTPLMLVQAGKDGVLRLLDRAHLHGVGGELQTVDIGEPLFSAPAIRRDARGTVWIYLGLANAIRAYRLTTDSNGKSRLQEAWTAQAGQTQGGTSPAIAGDVVFVERDGALCAVDTASGKTLWDSTRSGAGGTIGRVHWESPIVSGSSVYCADEDGVLYDYALRT